MQLIVYADSTEISSDVNPIDFYSFAALSQILYGSYEIFTACVSLFEHVTGLSLMYIILVKSPTVIEPD